MFQLRIAGKRVGTVGGSATEERVCRCGGVVRTVGRGDTMGDTLVDEGGRESNRQGVASILASVTVPAGLAQSVVCHGSFGSDPGRTWV